jgi:hypothetical protein
MSVATASALDAATLTRRDGPFWYIGWISSLIVRIAQSAPATAIVRVRQLVVVGVARANAVQRLMLVDSRASRNGPGCMQQPMTDGLFPLKKSRMRGTLETHRSLQCTYRVCNSTHFFPASTHVLWFLHACGCDRRRNRLSFVEREVLFSAVSSPIAAYGMARA